MQRWFDPEDRRGLLFGVGALVVTVVGYRALATGTLPLTTFALPGLLTAVLSGWRPTLVIGLGSLCLAVVNSPTETTELSRLVIRWLVIAVAVLAAALGAQVRQRQAGRIADLDETLVLLSAFERGLAPSPRPPAGVRAVARYRPAEERMQLGGDFLDAIALPDGRLAVLIGDVCGHGPAEAATGAALRAGWKGLALNLDTKDPAEWVAALERSFLLDGRIDTFVRLCTGTFDLQHRTALLVNAGHPLPIGLAATPAPFRLPVSPPLGVGVTDPRIATEIPWDGEPVLFYTDGLVENPRPIGPPRRWGEASLLAWLAGEATTRDLDALVTRLVAAATAGRDLRDDLAVLLVARDQTVPG